MLLEQGGKSRISSYLFFIFNSWFVATIDCFKDIDRSKSSLSSIKVVERIRDHQANDALRVWKDDPPHGD